MSSEWEAHVERHVDPLMYKLHLSQQLDRDPVGVIEGPVTRYLIGALDGEMQFGTRSIDTWAMGPSGIVVQRGMLKPIHDAVSQHVAPSPLAAEVAALREALTVERARVDRILGATLAPVVVDMQGRSMSGGGQ